MENRNQVTKRNVFSETIRIVPYLLPEEVQILAAEARKKRNGERDYLFILLLYQTGLRISEALSLTLAKIYKFDGKPVIEVMGKGKKPRLVSCPESLANKLIAYAYHKILDSQFLLSCIFYYFLKSQKFHTHSWNHSSESFQLLWCSPHNDFVCPVDLRHLCSGIECFVFVCMIF